MHGPHDHAKRVRAEPGTGPHPVHGHGTRSLRVSWSLAEMGVPHPTTPVPFPPRLKPVEAAVDRTGDAAARRFTVADISPGYAPTHADRLWSRPAHRLVMAGDPNRDRVIGDPA